jgi:hypothetical protein
VPLIDDWLVDFFSNIRVRWHCWPRAAARAVCVDDCFSAAATNSSVGIDVHASGIAQESEELIERIEAPLTSRWKTTTRTLALGGR